MPRAPHGRARMQAAHWARGAGATAAPTRPRALQRTATAAWRDRGGGAWAHATWRHLYCSGLEVSSSNRSLKVMALPASGARSSGVCVLAGAAAAAGGGGGSGGGQRQRRRRVCRGAGRRGAWGAERMRRMRRMGRGAARAHPPGGRGRQTAGTCRRAPSACGPSGRTAPARPRRGPPSGSTARGEAAAWRGSWRGRGGGHGGAARAGAAGAWPRHAHMAAPRCAGHAAAALVARARSRGGRGGRGGRAARRARAGSSAAGPHPPAAPRREPHHGFTSCATRASPGAPGTGAASDRA
jgi:hypothetical protein